MRLRMCIIRGIEVFCLLVRRTENIGRLTLSGQIFKYRVSTDTRIRIGNQGTIRMGCISTEANVHFTAWGGSLEIGNNCSFNRNDIVVCRKSVKIGNGTIMGPNVCIYDHDHVFGAEGKVDGEYHYSPIVIGNNVWIGAGVIILRGTTIGDNSVIGAGCVVSGEIPPGSLVTTQSRENTIVPLHG